MRWRVADDDLVIGKVGFSGSGVDLGDEKKPRNLAVVLVGFDLVLECVYMFGSSSCFLGFEFLLLLRNSLFIILSVNVLKVYLSVGL